MTQGNRVNDKIVKISYKIYSKVEILEELDLDKLEVELREIIEKKGIKNIAILLMHSYM